MREGGCFPYIHSYFHPLQEECTMREGGCVPSVYPIPPESFKVEVEEGNATEASKDKMPDGIEQAGLVRLDNQSVRWGQQ